MPDGRGRIVMLRKRIDNPSYLTLWALSVVVPFLWFKRREIPFWTTLVVVVVGYVFLAIWKIEGQETMGSLVAQYFFPLIFMAVAIAVTMFWILVALIWPFATSLGIVLPIALIVSGIGLGAYELYGYATTGSWDGIFAADLWSAAAAPESGAAEAGALAILHQVLTWLPVFVVLVFAGFLWIAAGEDRIRKMSDQLVDEYLAITERRDRRRWRAE